MKCRRARGGGGGDPEGDKKQPIFFFLHSLNTRSRANFVGILSFHY